MMPTGVDHRRADAAAVGAMARGPDGVGHVVARDVTVLELTTLLADWEAERREKARAQIRTRLLAQQRAGRAWNLSYQG